MSKKDIDLNVLSEATKGAGLKEKSKSKETKKIQIIIPKEWEDRIKDNEYNMSVGGYIKFATAERMKTDGI